MATLCPRCNSIDSEYSVQLGECFKCSEFTDDSQARRERIFNNTKHLLREDVEFVLTAPKADDGDDSSIGELSTLH